jgi:hypothetical protein
VSITSNTSAIAANTASITSNTSAIAANTASITAIASDVNSATASNIANTIVRRDGSGGFSTGTIAGTLSGTASNANTLTTGRTISATGDITYISEAFNGTADVSGVATLANSGVFSGTYGTSTSVPIITVDSKGRITNAITTSIPSATSTITGLLSSSDYEAFDQKLDDIAQGIGIQIDATTSGSWDNPRRGISISATDATLTEKGIIKLAGDLTGTAELPRVNTVGGVLSSTITTVASSVLSATANNTASTLVQRDNTGGFAAGAVTTTSVVSSGNISSTSLNTGTLKVAGGTPTVGFVLTASNIDGTASWQVASGGVTSVGAINTTSNAAGATVSGTTLNLAAADATNGGVLTNGAQTIAGEKSFKAAVTNAEASPFTTRIINFSLSNLAYTSQSPGAFTLSGMKNGGTYTLAVQGTVSGLSSFTHTNFNVVSLGNYTTPGGKQTVYTFIVMGTTIYHSMVSEQ